MSTNIVPAPQAPTDRNLAILAEACVAYPATNRESAVDQSIAFLAGIYGSRFQPSANSSLAWCALIGDALPSEIAKAVVTYVKDRECDDQGRAHSSFPPSGADIYVRVAAYREERLKEARQRQEREERAKEHAEWEASPAGQAEAAESRSRQFVRSILPPR